MLIKAILTLCIAASAIIGDVLVDYSDIKIVKALVDNCTHAIIGGFTWAVIQTYKKTDIHTNAFLEIFICTAASSLIDVDHFIAARSFRLEDVHQLKSRPFLHCTSLLIASCTLLIALSYYFNSQNLNTFGWIMLAAALSHHSRDATRRGYWNCPFGSSPPTNYSLYIVIIMLLPYVIAYLSINFRPTLPPNIVNMKNINYSLV